MAQMPRKGGPLALLAVGAVFFAAAYYWERLVGARPDPASRFYLQIFQGVAVIAMLSALFQVYRAWLIEQDRKAAREPSGVFGEARFADIGNCEAAGLLDPRGLYLGVIEGEPLFYSGKAHLLTAAPARTGKGIGVVIPNLLHFQGSVFVTDPKGELAAVTAKHRAERFGQKVLILNPWALHGLPQHRYNPLSPLIAAANDPALQRGLGDEAKALALQLLPEPEDPRNRYFRDGARMILRALMLHFATRSEPERCTLPEIWRALTSPKRLQELIADMAGSTALGGALADMGDDLSHQVADNPEQFADFRQGALQALDIFDPAGWLGEAVSASDTDLAELKNGRVSVYCVIPQDRIATHGAWLGIVTGQAIISVARAKGRTPVLFLLDEFANMGKLSGLAESLTALPGLGVRVWVFVQELAEVIRLYGPHTAQTVLSQAEVKQFFSVRNVELSRTLSAMLGQKTVKTMNYNLGRDMMDEVGESLGETGRPLLSPDEIRQLPDDAQILLVNALPPVLAARIPFWFVKPWNGWAEPNPVEGPHPYSIPVVELAYRRRTKEAAE